MSHLEKLLAEVLALPLLERQYIVEQVCDTFDKDILEELHNAPRFLKMLDRRFFDGKPRIPESELWKKASQS